MTLKQKYLRLFVQCLLVAVAMVCVMPVLTLFTGTALGALGVTIPDDNLRAVLEQELGKGEGAPITEAELAGLTEINSVPAYGGVGIQDLTGIELCTNLQELNLRNNNINNINGIEDISALAALADLTVLYLENLLISDISALSNLTNLQELNLATPESATYRL